MNSINDIQIIITPEEAKSITKEVLEKWVLFTENSILQKIILNPEFFSTELVEVAKTRGFLPSRKIDELRDHYWKETWTKLEEFVGKEDWI